MPAWMHDPVENHLNPAPRDPATRLAKVYVEPTSRCNLACRTCMRNAWDEPLGDMNGVTFVRIMDGLRAIDPIPAVFFGGIGEPLFHPEIVEMVRRAKTTGAAVELITNGTLLGEDRARNLIAAGLDVLWISLDGATPESYTDVRRGAALLEVIAHVTRLRDLRGKSLKPEIGIAFVAMRRNIADLPALLRLARQVGASRFIMTNVLPYTPALCDEVLYARALSNGDYAPVPDLPRLSLPKMDRSLGIDSVVQQALRREWKSASNGGGAKTMLNRCPFIENGAMAVGWDGGVSPCLPLLHHTTSYLHGVERQSRRYEIGNVNERPLVDLWSAPEYRAFRERVRNFDFSPCAFCDGCPLSETNDEDCYGSTFPTCGGCLWAQGIIQCP